MTIDELISSLEVLKAQHGGNVDVTVWQYAGGDDELCDVAPVFDAEHGVIVFDTTYYQPSIRR